jgi:hypothetical protein
MCPRARWHSPAARLRACPQRARARALRPPLQECWPGMQPPGGPRSCTACSCRRLRVGTHSACSVLQDGPLHVGGGTKRRTAALCRGSPAHSRRGVALQPGLQGRACCSQGRAHVKLKAGVAYGRGLTLARVGAAAEPVTYGAPGPVDETAKYAVIGEPEPAAALLAGCPVSSARGRLMHCRPSKVTCSSAPRCSRYAKRGCLEDVWWEHVQAQRRPANLRATRVCADIGGHQMLVEEGRWYTCNRLEVRSQRCAARPLAPSPGSWLVASGSRAGGQESPSQGPLELSQGLESVCKCSLCLSSRACRHGGRRGHEATHCDRQAVPALCAHGTCCTRVVLTAQRSRLPAAHRAPLGASPRRANAPCGVLHLEGVHTWAAADCPVTWRAADTRTADTILWALY